MEPYNYSGAFSNVQSPADAFTGGLKTGASVADLQQQQTQKAAEQALKKKHAEVINSLISNKNAGAEEYGNAMLLVPGMKEQLKQSWDTKNTAQQQTLLTDLSKWGAAIQNGKPDIAIEEMRKRADAIEATAGGPTKESQAFRAHADSVALYPEYGGFMIKSLLASHPDGGKVVDALAKLGAEERAVSQAPADLRKKVADAGAAESDATTKKVTAAHAEENAIKDLAKKGWDITAIENDIAYKKESNRIAAMNAVANRESNTLKRDELKMKIKDAEMARDEKVREKVANAETEVAVVTDAKGLLGEILSDKDTLKAATGASAWRGVLPGTKARTMAGKIEQLENTFAATNLDKLKGAMSDKDIMFLKKIGTNLDRYQAEEGFADELGKALSILDRAEEKLRKKNGMPPAPKPAPTPPTETTVGSTPPSGGNRNIVVDF